MCLRGRGIWRLSRKGGLLCKVGYIDVARGGLLALYQCYLIHGEFLSQSVCLRWRGVRPVVWEANPITRTDAKTKSSGRFSDSAINIPFSFLVITTKTPPMFSRTLKNTGSTARDHLASERTFLAWLRTGLGFIALGIAVERFSQFELVPAPPSPPPIHPTSVPPDTSNDKSEDLVLGLLGIGSGSIVYGTTRYFSNMKMLERGLYRPSSYGAAGLSGTVVGLTGVACWRVLRGKKEEKG